MCFVIRQKVGRKFKKGGEADLFAGAACTRAARTTNAICRTVPNCSIVFEIASDSTTLWFIPQTTLAHHAAPALRASSACCRRLAAGLWARQSG